MKKSESIKEISKAMSLTQKTMKPAQKDSSNPHFKSKFSTLTAVWETLRDPMTNNLLSVVQDVTTQEKSVLVETTILHDSGEWMSFGPLCLPVIKPDAQGFGSAISYAKRYALCSVFGVVSDEDDDGNLACDKHTIKSVQQTKISKEQFGLLSSKLDRVPHYKAQVKSWLAGQGIHDLMDVHSTMFEGIMKAADKAIEMSETAQAI